MDQGNTHVLMTARIISASSADVDGTGVTKKTALTKRAVESVQRLHQNGIDFFITSGRPPRGMRMLVEPLGLKVPVAAFNGRMILHPDLSVIDKRPLPDAVVPEVTNTLLAHGLDVWIAAVRSGTSALHRRLIWIAKQQRCNLPTVVPTFRRIAQPRREETTSYEDERI